MIKNSLKDIKNISYYLNNIGIEENTRPEDISVQSYCRLTNLIFRNTKE